MQSKTSKSLGDPGDEVELATFLSHFLVITFDDFDVLDSVEHNFRLFSKEKNPC